MGDRGGFTVDLKLQSDCVTDTFVRHSQMLPQDTKQTWPGAKKRGRYCLQYILSAPALFSQLGVYGQELQKCLFLQQF